MLGELADISKPSAHSTRALSADQCTGCGTFCPERIREQYWIDKPDIVAMRVMVTLRSPGSTSRGQAITPMATSSVRAPLTARVATTG